MHKQWSESAVEQTQAALEQLSFAARAGKVWLKQTDGGYGYINDDDALRAARPFIHHQAMRLSRSIQFQNCLNMAGYWIEHAR